MTMIPSHPARFRRVPRLPPHGEQSPTVPVSGERDIRVILPEVGEAVPTRGPVNRRIGMSESSQGRAISDCS
jgi:hypothetical protein